MKMNENKNELKNKCVSFMLKFATLKVYAQCNHYNFSIVIIVEDLNIQRRMIVLYW